MICNLGNIERIIRIVVGAGLVAVGYFTDLPQAGVIAVYLVGAVALVTGIGGFCPAWKLLGINTCATKTATKS